MKPFRVEELVRHGRTEYETLQLHLEERRPEDYQRSTTIVKLAPVDGGLSLRTADLLGCADPLKADRSPSDNPRLVAA